jgi:hypothetical protein
MKGWIFCLALVLASFAVPRVGDESSFNEWEKYKAARTADQVTYLTEQEKNVYYFINLARMNPPLFAETYVKSYSAVTAAELPYKKSLYTYLKKLKPRKPLIPDKGLFDLAKCFALEQGKNGGYGHDRKKCADGYFAECCSYGCSTGFSVVLQLLIDYGNPECGHRKICLDYSYTKLGASIQPHKKYESVAVLDFR